MKMNMKTLQMIGAIGLCIMLAAWLIMGCSEINMPTASQTDSNEENVWSPEPGFSVNGRTPIPIVNDTYWEDLYGPSVNPFRCRAVVSREIDGDVGGTVTCGYHRYDVPAGAVDGDVIFTMQIASYNGIAVDCGPSPMSFNIPVMLTLSYAGTQYDNNSNDLYNPADLRIYYMTEDGDYELLDDAELNTGSKTVTAPVTHFSRYILG
jgi:hypothetical protein